MANPDYHEPRRAPDYRQKIAFLFTVSQLFLTKWERNFIAGVNKQTTPLSRRQHEILNELYDKHMKEAA